MVINGNIVKLWCRLFNCTLIWGIDDVHQANKNTEHRALSDQEALLILSHVEHDHDANQGISWDTITWHIANYFETEGRY